VWGGSGGIPSRTQSRRSVRRGGGKASGLGLVAPAWAGARGYGSLQTSGKEQTTGEKATQKYTSLPPKTSNAINKKGEKGQAEEQATSKDRRHTINEHKSKGHNVNYTPREDSNARGQRDE